MQCSRVPARSIGVKVESAMWEPKSWTFSKIVRCTGSASTFASMSTWSLVRFAGFCYRFFGCHLTWKREHTDHQSLAVYTSDISVCKTRDDDWDAMKIATLYGIICNFFSFLPLTFFVLVPLQTLEPSELVITTLTCIGLIVVYFTFMMRLTWSMWIRLIGIATHISLWKVSLLLFEFEADCIEDLGGISK